VALPNSISPEHYETAAQPPADLFDLLIVDEAHHTPAPTWNAILGHFRAAKAVLLTATPRRRDRKRVPGKLVYYYPLSRALSEHLFQPTRPIILPVEANQSRADLDEAIAVAVSTLLASDEHRTSQFVIRASTIERATALAARYRELGHAVAVVHSRMSSSTQGEAIEALRAGKLRGVAVVGMLIEGFDLPSLRVAAYHDKHKSLEATAQLIGRLARVDPAYPQTSVVVTVNDVDVYPQLQGVVRALYDEDRDWTTILPGVIDAEVQEDLQNLEYARSYQPPVSGIDLAALHPLRRATLFEIADASSWEPPFSRGAIPSGLEAGASLGGQVIVYAGLNPGNSTLLLVTSYVERPHWHDGNALDARLYELHALSYRRSSHTGLPHLLLVNTKSAAFVAALLETLNATDGVEPADPERLQKAFDSLARVSVSSVGVRNTYSVRGVPSYRMYAGSRIEGGLRQSDTSHSALGHAMVQVGGETSAFTAGVSTGKGKYWETRYTPLRQYERFVTDFCERYWFPTPSPAGPLLPQISRGRLLTAWPESAPIAAELDYALIGTGWEIEDIGPLDAMELFVGSDPTGTVKYSLLPTSEGSLPLLAGYPVEDGMRIIWEGAIDLSGVVTATSVELNARRGYGHTSPLGGLLTDRPPMVYFLDGTTVHGRTIHPPQVAAGAPLDHLLEIFAWAGVDIQAETRASAANRGRGRSVHEAVEQYLLGRPRRFRHRWILLNDGAGEIADYVLIECDQRGLLLGLWHAKAAGGETVGVRVTDLENVVAQAIKSRRWITDRRLWGELAARIRGDASPKALLLEGSARALDVLLGEYPRWQKLALDRKSPRVQAEIGIAQPGLSRGKILSALATLSPGASAVQIQQLLTVWQDSLNPIAPHSLVLCSE